MEKMERVRKRKPKTSRKDTIWNPKEEKDFKFTTKV